MTNPRQSTFIPGLRRVLRLYLLFCVLGGAAAVVLFLLTRGPLSEQPAADPLLSLAPAHDAWLAPPPSHAVWVMTSRDLPALPAQDRTRPSPVPSGAWWWNVVHQEHGAASLSARGPLTATVPAVVLTREVAEQGDPATLARQLEPYVRSGGLLILEGWPHTLDTLAGADRADGPPVTVRALATSDGKLALPVGIEVEAEPVQLRPGSEPLLTGTTADGRSVPLAWRAPVDAGGVVGLSFDLGRLLMRHVQGTPKADFSFTPRPREGALSGIPVPADMAAPPETFDNPALDRLVQHLWSGAQGLVPSPGWWPWPEGSPGIYLATHDEEGFGDRSVFAAEEEHRRGVATTWFVLPSPITRGGIAAIRDAGGEVAVHWHRGFGGGHTVDETLGPVVLRRRALPLAEQQAKVGEMLGSSLPPLTRIHGLQWDPDFDTTFRKLAAAGIELDSSYGPYGDLPPYLFGSVMPFRPVDREGRMLPLLELPFVLQDDETAPLDRLRRLVADGARWQLPVVPIFHVNTMSYKPSVGPIEAWIEGFELAREAGLWQGTVGRYLDFLKRRADSKVAGSPAPDGRWLGRIDARGEGLSLRLPASSRKGGLTTARLDGRPAAGIRCLERSGQGVALLPVAAGDHALELVYGPGESVCGRGERASEAIGALPAAGP